VNILASKRSLFCKKAPQKTFINLGLCPINVMPAEAGIHAFRASPSPTPGTSGQKSFAELFFRKATACFGTTP
jgi:hypothetical protein